VILSANLGVSLKAPKRVFSYKVNYSQWRYWKNESDMSERFSRQRTSWIIFDRTTISLFQSETGPGH